MNIRKNIASLFGLKTSADLQHAVTETEGRMASSIDLKVNEAVQAARQSMPLHLDYDPNGDGYRRITGQSRQQERDLAPLSQDTMLELAYYLYDTSGLVKRFVKDTRNFVMGEGITYEVENDEDDQAKKILDDFWNDPVNQMELRLSKRIEFLGLLGEQCWPVQVCPHTGKVWVSYVDPVNIAEVILARDFPELAAAVKLKGSSGRSGRTLTVIRHDNGLMSKTKGRLVGNCFFFSINNPPNASRGRSDLIHLFDFIDAFEGGLFDDLDRAKMAKSFIWDVTLEDATEGQIQDFIKKTPTPKPGSMRVHNQKVTYKAETPDLKNSDNKALFDTAKNYIAACINRPENWFGSGGKVYSTEADGMDAPTFKDLSERQKFIKLNMEMVLRFVLDQAIIHKTLQENPQEPFKVKVNMPEMSAKELQKTVSGLTGLSISLGNGVDRGWITDDAAARIYTSVASQTGVDVKPATDAEQSEAASKKPKPGEVTEDYKKAKKPPESV